MKNFASILQQATKAQQQMATIEKEVNDSSFSGNSGGNMVEVTIKGNIEIIDIKIDNSLFKDEEKTMMIDLIIAAFNEAKRKAEEHKKNKLSEITSGLSLPPGFSL